jgi:hypothetical protein
MNRLISLAVERITLLLAENDPAALGQFCSDVSHKVQSLMDIASAIIHGSAKRFNQSDIDGFLRL